MPLISVQQATKIFSNRAVLDKVSLSVNEGDKIALIGENGAGKTTLMKIIEGKLAPDEGIVLNHAGTITGFLAQNLEDQVISDTPIKNPEILRLEKKIHEISTAMEKADETELPPLLRQYQEATARFEMAGGYDYEHRIREALHGLGLSQDDIDRPISSFSGGERMRVSLAKLVVMRPNVLFLDEPTNHLDASALLWLEEYLSGYGGAVMFISHDRTFIDAVANRVLELENGKLTLYRGNYSEYCRQKEEIMRDRQRMIRNLEREVARQEEVTQTMLSHRKMKSYHAREKLVGKLSDKLESEKKKLSGGPSRMSFSFVPESSIANRDSILLQAENLSMAYPGSPTLFQGVNFFQKATEKIFLTGSNGCGKTTLLRLMTGQIPDFDGTILIRQSLRYGTMGQFVSFDDENKTPLEELSERSDLTETQARTLLARFGFRDVDVFKSISVLSGGERSRLFLCCLLQEKPDMLFLDEPTNHLDIYSREILENALKDYHGAILAISHDRFFIEKCADRVLGFYLDQVLPFDSYKEYVQFIKDKKESAQPVKKEIVSIEKKEIPGQKERKNRSIQRRDIAKRKEQIRALEQQITEWETCIRDMEAGFGPDTDPQEYVRYHEAQNHLAECYENYVLLADEPES